MNFLRKEFEKIKEYFHNNSLIIFVLSCFSLISSLTVGVYGLISKNLNLLWIATFILILFCLWVYINKNYIRIKNLFLDEDTYLINALISIIEVRKLKQNEDINYVNVKELKCLYTISEANTDVPQQSKLNVKWEVSCNSLNKELLDYRVIYTKDKLTKKSEPQITIKEFDNEYYSKAKSHNNNLLNHFEVPFKNGNFPCNNPFKVTIELNDYYQFMWNNYEVIIVNPSLWGKTIEKISITLIFNDSKIAGSIISVYKISQTNLNRKLIKKSSCQKNSSGEYEFQFDYDKIGSNDFFIIKIPKHIN